MAGMNGFVHSCESVKTNKKDFKKSIMFSDFSIEEINIIWDFYVTHSLSEDSGLSRNIMDYGWNSNTDSKNGYPAIEKLFCKNIGVKSFCIIRSTTCKDTLNEMDLSNDEICITHSRVVMLQKYTTNVNENEMCTLESKESRIVCLMRHIRNSLAHGNTYFFCNGYVLLEDKDGQKITASILIPQKSLIDWIKIVDRNCKFYSFVMNEEVKAA